MLSKYLSSDFDNETASCKHIILLLTNKVSFSSCQSCGTSLTFRSHPHVTVAAFLYSAAQNCTSAQTQQGVLLQEDAPAQDSASAAAAELVAEEQQEAAKAAAKKAKKLRQKVKAKKQAQPEAAASAAAPHDARIPTDQAHQLSPESTQFTMVSSELSSSAGQHQAEGYQAHGLEQQQQQQRVEAEGTSLSVSSALDAAAREKAAQDVAVQLEGLPLPSCNQSANGGHTDAGFLQQLFCCPLTKVSHLFAISMTGAHM